MQLSPTVLNRERKMDALERRWGRRRAKVGGKEGGRAVDRAEVWMKKTEGEETKWGGEGEHYVWSVWMNYPRIYVWCFYVVLLWVVKRILWNLNFSRESGFERERYSSRVTVIALKIHFHIWLKSRSKCTTVNPESILILAQIKV